MKEVVLGIHELIVAEGTRAYLKRLDSTTGKEGVVVRQFAADVILRRFMDGTERLECTTQVLSRHQDREAAMDECEKLANLLDGAHLESDAFQFIDQEVYLDPQEIEDDEADYSTWSVVIKTNITRKRPHRR